MNQSTEPAIQNLNGFESDLELEIRSISALSGFA